MEDDATNPPQGHWCKRVPWSPRCRPARTKGLSCQRVCNRVKYSLVETDESRRTVRGAKLAANKEIYQKIYGSVVEIVAIDDLLRGDFTAALQGEGEDICSCSATYSHPAQMLMLSSMLLLHWLAARARSRLLMWV